MDARETKARAIKTREEMAQTKQKLNLESELDRIKGQLSRSVVPSRGLMLKRQKDLENMIKSINEGKHFIKLIIIYLMNFLLINI